MAAANDNQGLKIAVAALVMLVFILGVTNYFAFSSSSREFARAEKATSDATASEGKARSLLEQVNGLHAQIGYPNIDDADAFKTAATKDLVKITQEIQSIGNEYLTAVAEVQKAGEPDPKLDDLKTVGLGLVSGFISEPNENKVYVKSLDRLKDLMLNQSRLMRELSLDYRKIRLELASANSVNSVEVSKVIAARDQATKEKQDEIGRFKTEVQSLYDQITALQNSDKDKTNNITDLGNKLNDETNKFVTFKRDAQKSIQDLKDKLNLKFESFTGKALGRVTYIDYNRGEIRISANKADGVKPMMRFTIFDRDAQGIPSDKPKGAIQVITVGDPVHGEHDSVAKIVETKDSLNPIRYNDQIYSPALLAGSAERYAIIGKMDLNRDGRDDRADLIRLIEQSGGVVEYDLPPPGVDRTPGRLAVERAFAKFGEPVPPVTGRGSGRISPLAKAYVLDEGRQTLSGTVKPGENLTPDAVAFNKEKSDAIKEARANGVTPIPLDRLLLYFGYSPRTSGVDAGNIEMKNRSATKQLLKPQPIKPGAAPAGGNTTPPAADAPATPPTEKASDPK